MRKSLGTILALLLINLLVPTQVVASSPQFPSSTATKVDNGTTVTITISVDSTGTGGQTLIRGSAPSSASQVRVGNNFSICPTASPTSLMGCTSLGGDTTTVTTSSNTVMQIVMTYPSQAFNSFLNLSPSQPHQFVGLFFDFSGMTSQVVFLNVGTTGVSNSPSSESPAPANYSGPELSGLSSKEIISGTSSRLEGKNLSSVTSIEIGGKPATFKLDGSSALDLTVPAGLAPGLYDLVINSPSGKLTHINAILVREPLRSFSITSRSEGRISEEHYQEHTIVASMQLPELNKARCVVNGPNLAQARAQAARLCALVKAANPNIQATVVEARSTVKGNTVFARVSYGWTK